MVVLGGGVEGGRPGWREGPDLSSAAGRAWFAARLYHAGGAPLVILAGGVAVDAGSAEPAADALAIFIEDLGVSATAPLLEQHTPKTWENALNSNRLPREHHIEKALLATSASHMPRAMVIFRKQGIAIIPAQTDFEAVPRRGPWLLRWLPDVSTLNGSSRAPKEYPSL